MNRDPFLRLALVAVATVYVLGLIVIRIELGWVTAFVAIVGGVVVAFLLTVDVMPEPPPPVEEGRPRRRVDREGRPVGFEEVT